MQPFLIEKEEDLIFFHRFISAFIIKRYLVGNLRNWLMFNSLFLQEQFIPKAFLRKKNVFYGNEGGRKVNPGE